MNSQYQLNETCQKCQKRAVVIFEYVTYPKDYDRFLCVLCMYMHSWKGATNSEKIKRLHFLAGMGFRKAEFHLWLLEQSRIKPSDLVHPNKYIREVAQRETN